jgi:predicted  nucleic acid-binding Zn-ribbon protein
MATIQEELNKLGKEIEAAKRSVAQLEGRKSEIMDGLKKNFNVDTISGAESLLKTMQDKVTAMDEEIMNEFEALKRDFSW